MAVVDINKKFLYNPVRPAFWEVDGKLYFPFPAQPLENT